MKRAVYAIFGGWLVSAAAAAVASEPPGALPIASPGLGASRVEADGRLVEDWGSVGVELGGAGIVAGAARTEAVTLDGGIPAVRVVADRGAVRLTSTVYRAPAYPAGVDVLTVRLEEARGQAAQAVLTLTLAPSGELGMRTVRLGDRRVVTLPEDAGGDQTLRDWGHADEATSLGGWAKPAVKCDPAFRSIRAGMGGVPIVYRFAMARKGKAQVVLGLCESHWAQPGQRPLRCRVEGAPAQDVDPVAEWGQHQPGALLFAARDADGNGRIDVEVRAAPGAPDRNPILNALWVFPPGDAPKIEQVIAGELNAAATYYVDAGGAKDQSLYPPGNVEYQVDLPAGGAREFAFLVACQGGETPAPGTTAWTPDSLRRAAEEVWRDWPQSRRRE